MEQSVEFTDLLSVVGRVGEHGGHVKHQLVVLIGGVEGVYARGVGCNTGKRVVMVSGLLQKAVVFHMQMMQSNRNQDLDISALKKYYSCQKAISNKAEHLHTAGLKVRGLCECLVWCLCDVCFILLLLSS